MRIGRFWNYVLRHGLVSTFFHLGYRVTNSALMMMVFKIVVLDTGDWNLDLIPGDGEWRFLDREELERFSRADPSLNLTEDFLSQASARGDRCHGLIKGETLCAYAWYAKGPAPIGDSLEADFDPRYVYMYKAFTSPDLRGRRLYGAGVCGAMRELTRQGCCKGMISCVQSHNLASQKALERIGCRTVGRVVVLGGRQPCLTYSSRGCRSLFRARIQPSDPAGPVHPDA
jgi:hypothetical protein